MSRTLQYSVPPVEPTVLGSLGCSQHYVLEALNIGDPFDQTTKSSLASDPVVLRGSDPAVLYLRGVLAGLCVDPDDTTDSDANAAAVELTDLLAQIDARGSITIGAS